MNLQENIQRIKEVMGLITEEENQVKYLDNTTREYSGHNIEVINSPDTRIRIEGDKLVCGNVFYHGAMINDVKQGELPEYFSKKGTRFEFGASLKRLSGKSHEALFITPSFKEALFWANKNIRVEFKDKEIPANVSPSVYKVTLKPGILLEYVVITHFSYGEKERLEKKGCCGTYGGVNSVPSTLNMSECGILNPSCVEGWELVSGGENIIKQIDTDEYNTKVLNKNLDVDSFKKIMNSMGIDNKHPKWNEYKEKYLDPWHKNDISL